MNRREFLKKSARFGLGGAGLAGLMGNVPGCVNDKSKNSFGTAGRQRQKQPNFVVIFADDMGYGDAGCFGHPTISTPNLDRMAAEGMKFTQFYSAASVCTPSRAALMTGRLPIRNGMCSNKRRVLFPNSAGGLPAEEITIAGALKSKDYATGCIGKWHLGHLPEFLPTRRGFDSYYGIPYSNDMKPSILMEGEKIIEQPVQQQTLTRRYTAKAKAFIEQHRTEPFFLYMAHSFPHVPLFASDKFKDTSRRGLYGDVVEELDWSVGKIMDTLRRLNLAENTLVMFTSDNGPWLTKKLHGGSAGLLRGGKGSTWEGGMREPGLAWWPGRVKAGTVNRELAGTMDIFATFLDLAGVDLPRDRVIDGVSMAGMLLGDGAGKRQEMFYYRGEKLFAVRQGPWKAHYITQSGYKNDRKEHDPPLLFHLDHDPAEKFDVAQDHPEVLAQINKLVQQHQEGIKSVPSQLEKKINSL
ncbi:MAG: sulfatase [Sedimentisphaerales bacterium]|nr:sulfatase [Sedimentisphaerales bacterium]